MKNRSGYDLLTDEQRAEMDNLSEKHQHQATMHFTALDMARLREYKDLCIRLENEQ